MNSKNNIQQEPFLWVDFKTDEFKVAQEMVQSWNMELFQLDGGSFDSHFRQLILPEMQIGHAQINAHLDQIVSCPEGTWTFVILHDKASMIKFNHVTTLSSSTMLVYAPGDVINAVSYEGFHIYTLSVKQSHFQQLTQALGLDKIEEKLSKVDRVELDTEQADSLRNQLKDILTDASSSQQKVMTQEGKDLLLNFVPIKFLKEIGSKIGCSKEKVMKEKHFMYLEVRAYMHTHLHEAITIEEISKKFKIPERTLRVYFKEELNTSPKQYLISLRLRKIRDELKVSKMQKGVVEKTARKFGFFHMSRFSRVYKDFFDELPSETLAQV